MINSLVAVFKSHEKVEKSLKNLVESGFDMKKLSVIGKDHFSKNSVVAHYFVNKEPKYYGSLLWDYLPYDKGVFVVPGYGPFGVGGPLVSLLDDSLEEGKEITEGFSFIDKALVRVGIPKDQLPKYQEYLGDEDYLLIIHGTPEDIKKGNMMLSGSETINTAVYTY